MHSGLPHVIQLSDFPASPARVEALHQGVHLDRLSRMHVLEEELPIPGVVGLLPIITDRVDGALMDQLPDLKIIANYGAGVDNIDVAEATRRGIQVTNTPGVLSEATADLTWGLILAACRRMVESDAVMRANRFPGWSPDYQLGVDVYGQTLGIVGLGKIGQAVARRAVGFGMTILYTQRTPLSPGEEQALNAQYRPLEALLRESDIVSLHAPLSEQTRQMINRDSLGLMKPHSVLINTARGPLVDEAALAEALRAGRIFAAGLDVFEKEPVVHPELTRLSNVVMTAHIGSATESTRKRMGDLAIDNLLAFLARNPLPCPVNQI